MYKLQVLEEVNFTVSLTDLDRCYRADYFRLILTTLEANFIFKAAGTVAKIALSLKLIHHKQI
jgi:hypothetical protein